MKYKLLKALQTSNNPKLVKLWKDVMIARKSK